jgi:hypothetical protein
MALCLKPCLEEADRSLEAAIRSLARHAREHRDTPMLGRTLMQPAVPITAGLKIARWAVALAQDRERLAEAQAAGLALQLGGPVGDLASLGSRGAAVRHRMALRLGLADARAWHSHRNAWLDLLGRITQTVLTAGKIARDVALAAQPEVGEMREDTPAKVDARAPWPTSATPWPARTPSPPRRACRACLRSSTQPRFRSTSAGLAAGRPNSRPSRHRSRLRLEPRLPRPDRCRPRGRRGAHAIEPRRPWSRREPVDVGAAVDELLAELIHYL